MTEPAAEFPYARFWRCALQVNPYSYAESYRGGAIHGLTEDDYNAALLERCRQLNIKVVGVADHGSVEAIDRLRAVLEPGGIVVFPGFEIASTEKVHMVCLFPEGTSSQQLERHLGALELTEVGDGTRPSRLGCLDLAKKIQGLGGFWFAAHVVNNSGLLRLNQDGGGLPHIWKDCDTVRVAQIPAGTDELDRKYQQILANKDPAYQRERPIALIHAKDVARPEDLAAPGATTWIKMTRPTFEAFKVAFLDPESRVRRDSELLEHRHGVVRSLSIDGGYLDGVRVHLSDHLNTVIGGRGTGKSTLIELLRYALDLRPKGRAAQRLHEEIVKENLGKASGRVTVALQSAAQHGLTFKVSRRHGEPPIVRDEHDAVSQFRAEDLLPGVEVYGQNEIYELAQDASRRARLLDSVLAGEGAYAEERDRLRKQLEDNRRRLLDAQAEHDELRERLGKLPRLLEQLRTFEELGIQSKLAQAPLFTREKQLVERVDEELTRLDDGIAGLQESLPDLTFLSDKALEGLPNATSLASIRAVLEKLRAGVQPHLAAARQLADDARAALGPARQTWAASVSAGEAEVEDALARLPDQAGRSGREAGTAYRSLAQEIERIRPLEAKEASFRQLVESLRKERSEQLAALSDLRTGRASELTASVKKLNKRLDGRLRITIRPEGELAPLTDFLANSPLDNVGRKRLAFVEERDGVTPSGLVHAIRDGEDALKERFGLTPGVAAALAKLPEERVLELEELELAPKIEIELNMAHKGPPDYRPLEKLSTGQQCTAVLHLLLLDSTDPLIIDQPEDNLDNAFIADRIVTELRRAKTKRQFIFSTHNANIPVFGDAEWIGVVTSEEGRGAIPPKDQGSIDVPTLRDQVASILEGGKEAFMQRKEKYDF